MRQIKAILKEGIIYPEEPLPNDALQIVCDGSFYTIYEDGDILPPVPIVLPEEDWKEKILNSLNSFSLDFSSLPKAKESVQKVLDIIRELVQRYER